MASRFRHQASGFAAASSSLSSPGSDISTFDRAIADGPASAPLLQMVIVSIHEKRAALQAVINATAAYALNVVAGFAGIDRTARVSPRPPVVVGEIAFAAAMRFAADSFLGKEIRTIGLSRVESIRLDTVCHQERWKQPVRKNTPP